VKVQVTVVVTNDSGSTRVDSSNMLLTAPGSDDVVANAARRIARRMGLGKPTPEKEGGRA
jgi:hypothetical protein